MKKKSKNFAGFVEDFDLKPKESGDGDFWYFSAFIGLYDWVLSKIFKPVSKFKLFNSVNKRRFAGLFGILIIIVPILLEVFIRIEPPLPAVSPNASLPYQEKIAEGVYALKNREPIHQVLAEGKKADLNLKKSSGLYEWKVVNQNGTTFYFGKKTSKGISPSVKVENKDGYFVEYFPKGFEGTVVPIVDKNIISWEIAEGITARYTMMADRVKADYIVKDQKSINNNQLEFDVKTGNVKSEARNSKSETNSNDQNPNDRQLLKGELLPTGDIDWYTGDLTAQQTQFTFPKPIVYDKSENDPKSLILNHKSSPIGSEYDIKKIKDGEYALAIILDKEDLESASWPLTIDPQVIDSFVSGDATEYAISRLLQRDAWGNLIAVFKEAGSSASTDDVWYKNYNSTTWTDAGIDIDGDSARDVEGLSVDIDSSGNIHAAVTIDTWSLIYRKITLTRNANNEITGTAVSSSLTLNSSGVAREHVSIIVANKGGGAGIEKVAVSYNHNTANGGTRRGEIHFMQCDVADDCTTASNWKNASEEKNGSGTCTDTGTGNVGLPDAVNCKGTADALFSYTAAHTRHHAVLTQMPYKPKRSPASVKKDLNGTFTSLTNTTDGNGGTTDDVNSLTTTDYIYIGDDKPFSKATFDLTNTNNNQVQIPTREYWNGTGWTSLSNFTDNTMFTEGQTLFEDGSMLFDEPSNWATTTVDGVSGKYWIRVRPSGALDSSVSIAEVYVNNRNSGALLVVGGVDDTQDLRAAYVPWDEITGDRWENNSIDATTNSEFREDSGGASSALDNLGGDWTTTYNDYPLTATVDYINNRAYIAYVEDTTTDVLHVKTAQINKDLTAAANWTDTSFPTVTEGTELVMSLTSEGSDIYLFYVLDPGTNSLVFRRCSPSGGGDGNICDNASDWGSEKTLDNGTDNTYPQAVVTKVNGDTVAIDTIYTTSTGPAVEYERQYVDMTDKTVVVAASGDDAFHRDCETGTDDQDITGASVVLGREITDISCDSNANSNNHVGLRFPSINVAQGTKISSAYIDVRVNYPCDIFASRYNADDTSVFAKLKNIIVSPAYAAPAVCNDNTSFTIYGEDVDDAASFSTSTNCTDPCSGVVGERTRTTSSISQAVKFDTITYRFDVTDIVQEIVCRGAANSQPCVGDLNGSGSWASGNDLAILLISTDTSGIDLRAEIVAQDDGTTIMLDPTLQINVAPAGVTDSKFSMGSASELATGSASMSVSDLDHPLSSSEFGALSADDNNYASVSATTNYASQSAQPAFMIKVNNSNNNNTYKIDASAVLRSSLATSIRPAYLQVYRGGSTDNWVTIDSDSATASDTDITLTGSITTNLSEYYFNETPGLGTQYAECTDGTANCWSYWRIYQDAPSASLNEVLSLDYVNVSYSINEEPEPSFLTRFRSGRLRGNLRLR